VLSAKNPMRRVLMITLCFEVIVFGLAVPVMHYVSSVPLEQAALLGGGAALLAIVSAALMRSPIGYVLGWLTQLAGLALGFLTPSMFAVGAMFAAIWVVTVILGRKLDANAAASPEGERR
jgi:hypothetical protein